jgi:hypothetical protein
LNRFAVELIFAVSLVQESSGFRAHPIERVMAGDDPVKNGGSKRQRATRREFLTAAAAATFGLCSATGRGSGQSSQPATSRPTASRPAPLPWWIKGYGVRSRVVDVRSRAVVHSSAVDRVVLGEMFDEGIRKLTGASTVGDAWQSVLGSSERIVLKFNSVGAGVINTNDDLARLLVERLAQAGYGPEKIALVELPEFLPKQLGTRPLERGWGGAIEVGAGPEQLAQYLHEADAIINVPLLKTHQIAGMTCSMKNLSHALIRHPARYHKDGCSPFVGQVIGAQEVSSKLRLNLANAIRVVARRGPAAREEDIVGCGALLLGFDPVALDSVGLSILSRERRQLGLPPRIDVRYLASAAGMGLGRWRPADIDLVYVEVDR